MSGLDNVRNITGSPISGIDPHELLDVRPLVHGEPEWSSSSHPNLRPAPCAACYSVRVALLTSYHDYVGSKVRCHSARASALPKEAELTKLVPVHTAINAMHTNNGLGNPELANLPRKLNIGLSNSRDDFPHTHINDVGLKAVKHPDTGEVHLSPELQDLRTSCCSSHRTHCWLSCKV